MPTNAVVSQTPSAFGIFRSAVDQANSDPAGDVMPAEFEVTDSARGISIVDGKQIKVEKPGVYSFQFFIQLYSDTQSATPLTYWLRKNGVGIDGTRRRTQYPGSEADQYETLEAVLELAANDVVELVWQCSDTAMALINYPAADGTPAMPSTYASVSMVSG